MCDLPLTMNGLFVAILLGVLSGCSADQPLNPTFPLTLDQAKHDLAEMAEHPKPLVRPVVVLGGWIDPGIASSSVGGNLRRVFNDDRVIEVSFAFCGDFDDCRARVLERVAAKCPVGDDGTIEVDAIGVSMGGIVARYATVPAVSDDDKLPRLKVVRLFTIATPHRGAVGADIPAINRLQRDMREGSSFLTELDRATSGAAYELYPYVRLDDRVVGPANAAPIGCGPWWVPNRFLEGAHLGAHRDPRILADIFRRLRGEQPYATLPAAPVPAREDEAATSQAARTSE